MKLGDLEIALKENEFHSAGGTSLQLLDNKSRIFVNVQMRRYFQSGEKAEDDDKNFCWVGYPENFDQPCLILMNQKIHDEIGAKVSESIAQNFNRVDPDSLRDVYSGFSLFHDIEIKSNRIQLTKEDRNMLDLPKDDNRIVIVGVGKLYHVWSFKKYSELNPKAAEFLEKSK